MSESEKLKQQLKDAEEEADKYKKMFWSAHHEKKIQSKEIFNLKRQLSIYKSTVHRGKIVNVSNDNTIGYIQSNELKGGNISFHKNNCYGFILKKHTCIEKKVQFRLDFTHGKYQALDVCSKDPISNKDVFKVMDDLIENPNVFEKIDDIVEENIFEDKTVWYMNGYNPEHKEGILKIWETLIDNGFVYTFVSYVNGVNTGLIDKLCIGDIIAWYFPERGYVAILEISDNLSIMDDETLKLISPSFKSENETTQQAIEKRKQSYINDKWNQIKIPVNFLAHTNKNNCVTKYDLNWDDEKEWVKGRQSARSQQPTSIYWKDQVFEIYQFMKK